MTKEAEAQLERPAQALPVTITHGMPVVEFDDGVPGTIAGFTQAFCIYRTSHAGSLVVASWRDIALGHVCPAAPLLPSDVRDNDRDNARAMALRELLILQQFGLTAAQRAALEDLTAQLCRESLQSGVAD